MQDVADRMQMQIVGLIRAYDQLRTVNAFESQVKQRVSQLRVRVALEESKLSELTQYAAERGYNAPPFRMQICRGLQKSRLPAAAIRGGADSSAQSAPAPAGCCGPAAQARGAVGVRRHWPS